MALVAAQTAFAVDSLLARDQQIITSHFNVHTLPLIDSTDWDDLATDLNNAIHSALGNDTGHQQKTTLYNLDDAKPRPVKAVHTINSGLSAAADRPREVALCLSFHADRNIPRYRGRVFVPGVILPGSLGGRPTTAQQNTVLSLAAGFANLGAGDVDWCVFSRVDNVHRPVQHAWVDDEWDTIRSRGARATTRVQQNLSE